MTPLEAVKLIEYGICPWFVVDHPHPDFTVMRLRRDGRTYRLTFEVEDDAPDPTPAG